MHRGEQYLPKSGKLSDSFKSVVDYSVVSPNRNMIMKMDFDTQLFYSQFLLPAGFAALLHSRHPETRQIASSAWKLLQDTYTQIIFSNNTNEMFHTLHGINEASFEIENERPFLLPVGEVSDIPPITLSQIYTTPELLVLARTNPIAALSQIAWVASQLHDFYNNRINIDPEEIKHRAFAHEAQLLLEAESAMESYQVTEDTTWALQVFPNGYASLPNRARYKARKETGSNWLFN